MKAIAFEVFPEQASAVHDLLLTPTILKKKIEKIEKKAVTRPSAFYTAVMHWACMKTENLCSYKQKTNISMADNLYIGSQILN